MPLVLINFNFFSKKGFDVVGIDNNLRKFFFGNEGSTHKIKEELLKKNKRFKNFNIDIRSYNGLEKIFKKYKKNKQKRVEYKNIVYLRSH